ncbi:MAG TPA: GGDEF domain-containing protein [Rhodocyclaceae bacterium]
MTNAIAEPAAARRAHPEMRFARHDGIRLPRAKAEHVDEEMDFRLGEIMRTRALTALFQPIVDLATGSVAAYEGLIRGPSNSPLHSPLQLFRAAAICNRAVEVEHLCRRATLESFARLALPGDLFLNVSPDCLVRPEARYGETLAATRELGIDPQRVVIELTEQQPTYDYELLREAARHYRAMGFRIAIDDLGEGFSSLRLWSELRPEFVKIDMHFIQGCDADPVKLQFLRSIQEIARNSGSQVIAEGIETAGELKCVRDLGIARGQGYYFARPTAAPPLAITGEAAGFMRHAATASRTPTAGTLARPIPPIASTALIDAVYQVFESQPDVQSIAVVEDGAPKGIIGRYSLIDRLARPYQRELFGRKPCRSVMNASPRIVEAGASVLELGQLIAESNTHDLADGFIVVDKGRYLGIGSSQDLMREITRLQLIAARNANPLTGLPGNDPLNGAIAAWLENGESFHAAYCDLDNFKPFNDVYGYAQGDEAIRLLAQTLVDQVDADRDFVGHIGGDDFMVLFRSPDWERRCQRILGRFEAAAAGLFARDDVERGGYFSEDRKGERVLVPLLSLSIGAVHAVPRGFSTHHQVSAAAVVAKKEAKKIAGNSLFVERRCRQE